MSTTSIRTARGGRARTMGAALAASSALLLSGCDFQVFDLPLPGGADVGDNPYTVTVEFRDVLDLVPQSSVRVDDIAVGRVTDIQLKGYTARVKVLLRKDVKLPDNAEAEIRQTSLLGEKFVSLAPPDSNPSSNLLSQGDVIGLEQTGRNVEVEEVLGALSLLLNGGGVGQLKVINEEVGNVLGGRTGTIKSVLRRLRTFLAQLDGSKFQILTALEQVNRLSKSLNGETDTLDLALKELPGALRTVDGQRDDLIKMLQALARLSGTATRVIKASKQSTITSLNALAPTLAAFASAGDNFPKALQLFLTYPFPDAVVGKTAAQARDLHMGDFTNLSAQVDIDAKAVLEGLPGGLPTCVPGAPVKLCVPGGIVPSIKPPKVTVPVKTPTVKVPGGGGGTGGTGGIKVPGVGRAAPFEAATDGDDAAGGGVDLELTGLLGWGVLTK